MTDDTRDTWPAPPAGMSMDDLSPQRLGLLMHQKMDVMGRELFQVRKQIREIEANLNMTMSEVCRHGKCIAPAVLVESVEDLAHD
jgi:hypothetical protein